MLEQIIQRFREEECLQPISDFSDELLQQLVPGSTRQYKNPMEIVLLDYKNQINWTKVVGCNANSRLRYPNVLGDPHQIGYVELAYVYSGVHRIQTEKQELVIREKEFCLIDPMLLRREQFGRDPFTVIFLCMSKSFFDTAFIRHLDHREENSVARFVINVLFNPKRSGGFLPLRGTVDTEEVEGYLAQIIRELQDRCSGYEYLIKGYSMRLMDVLTPTDPRGSDPKNVQFLMQSVYEQVIDYMKEHLDSVTLEDLEQQFHFQKDYFNRLLHKYANANFKEVLLQIRMDRAKYLLEHTQMSVADVVRQIGYQNISYFYRVFNDQFGTTPAAYRAKHQG